jgi:hypothetical protein
VSLPPPPPPPPPRPLPLPRDGLPRPPPFGELVHTVLREGYDDLRAHLLPFLRIMRVVEEVLVVDLFKLSQSSQLKKMRVAPRGGTVLVGLAARTLRTRILAWPKRSHTNFGFRRPLEILPSAPTIQQAQLTTSTMAKSAYVLSKLSFFTISMLINALQPPQHLPEGHRGPGDDP